jgi:predicted MFS family arabinose efflux permease
VFAYYRFSAGFDVPTFAEGTAERLIVAAVMRTEDIVNWRPVLAGLCANLVGIGLARFAYTPLIPALIAAHWFSPSATVYLGAANLAGYADQQRRAWGLCTTAFALGQAVAAYCFSYIFAHTGGTYRMLFALGAAALVIDVSIARLSTRRRRAECE